MNKTLNIIKMTRGFTKGSQSRAWWTVSDEDERLNVFDLTSKNSNLAPFINAGFMPEMDAMQDKDTIEWEPPIKVEAYFDGKYWNLLSVEQRDEHHVVTPYQPDLDAAKLYAARLARNLFDENAMLIDFETSSLRPDAQVVELSVMAIQDWNRQDAFTRLVHYEGVLPKLLAHIDLDQLKQAPDWLGYTSDKLTQLLNYRSVVAWNSAYDESVYHHMNQVYNVSPASYGGWIDAMKIASMFLGEWDASRDDWRPIKLEEAFKRLVGKTPEEAGYKTHASLDDILIMQSILVTIAQSIKGVDVKLAIIAMEIRERESSDEDEDDYIIPRSRPSVEGVNLDNLSAGFEHD